MQSKSRDKRHNILSYWIILLALSLAIPLHAQEWDTVWTKTYGWMNVDCAYAVAVDSEGYYIVGGYTWSDTTGEDLLIYKIEPTNGDTVWSKTYTIGRFFYQRAYSIAVDAENHYIVGGQYDDSLLLGFWDFWILKLDSATGDTLWAKSYGYGNNNIDWVYSVAIDSQGYYIVTGPHQVNGGTCCWVLKLNPEDGDTVWSKEYWKGAPAEKPNSVAVDSQHYYVVTGVIRNNNWGTWDLLLVKLNPIDGDTLWTKTYGGVDNYIGWAASIDHQGYYVVAGHTDSLGSYDVWVLKIDPANGDTVWTKTYGGGLNDYGLSVAVNSQGDYIVAGMTYSYGAGGCDAWVLKIDHTNGDTLWTKTYGGALYDRANAIAIDPQGYYIIGAETYSFGAGDEDMWVLKLKGTSTGVEEGYSLTDFSVTIPSIVTKELAISVNLPYGSLISLKIYDVLGRLVYKENKMLSSGHHKMMVVLPQGIYFVNLSIGQRTIKKKVVVLR